MPGTSYRADEYEAIVREVLAQVSLGAEHIAAVVGETRDAEPDRLAIARIGRERDAALARYRRDRDLRTLERTMAALDEQEAEAKSWASCRYRVTPLRPLTYIVADVTSYWVMALVGVVVLVIVAKLAYDVRFEGDILSVLAGFTLSTLAFLAIGS